MSHGTGLVILPPVTMLAHRVDPDNLGRLEGPPATALSPANTVHEAGLTNVVTARHPVGGLRCVAREAEGATIVRF